VEEAEVIGLLARACERLVGSIFTALDDEGFDRVTTTQALAVRILATDPMTARELAQALGITPQAASKVTAELESRGLAVRGHDPHDARARPLALTDEGRRAAETMRRAEARTIQLWQEATSPDDLNITARTLQAYLSATEPPRAAQTRRMRFT
jgi:DNA-binding MarR family transcriptional regulator